ncbi:hypothetical protein M569_15112 [Genlisea aurea]|uniref:Anther-specific protein BCP1 n=1 Tax=Genlisea aurea TaxID=192259 RepID=S8DAH0_9LAMI|nr:hypothetical protein M569_15112 [Genlisea aurea]
MARQISFIVALILFAVVGLAAATSGTANATASPTAVDAPATGDDSVVGSTTEDGNSDAAPVGGPVPDGTFVLTAPAPAPGSGAAAIGVTVTAGAAAIAGVFCLLLSF